MPGYAKDGPVVCFFRADKYTTFGLTDKANLTREEGAPHQFLESAWYFTARCEIRSTPESLGFCVNISTEAGKGQELG